MIDNFNLPLLSILLFHSIVFTQSGLDKILNWKGNCAFTKETLSNKFPFSYRLLFEIKNFLY